MLVRFGNSMIDRIAVDRTGTGKNETVYGMTPHRFKHGVGAKDIVFIIKVRVPDRVNNTGQKGQVND